MLRFIGFGDAVEEHVVGRHIVGRHEFGIVVVDVVAVQRGRLIVDYELERRIRLPRRDTCDRENGQLRRGLLRRQRDDARTAQCGTEMLDRNIGLAEHLLDLKEAQMRIARLGRAAQHVVRERAQRSDLGVRLRFGHVQVLALAAVAGAEPASMSARSRGYVSVNAFGYVVGSITSWTLPRSVQVCRS